MGSSKSKESQIKGQIFISLESNSTTPGGIFKGTVHVSLLEQISNPALYLIFKGSEITDFKILHSNGKSSTYIRHKGKNSICALKTLLYEWPDKIALPGNFSFPFELHIYDSLITSFHASSLYGGFCKISYKVCAQLQANDRESLKFKEPVFVFTDNFTLPQEMYPNSFDQNCSGNGGVLCCFGNENLLGKTTIEKGIFGISDTIDINLETDSSKFLSNISRVTIEIKKILTMTANKLRPKVATQAISMLKINEKPNIVPKSGSQNFTFKIPIQEILKNENCFTWSSELIKCQFVISIKLHTKTFWRCYLFNEASQGIVILPFQMQVQSTPPPIEIDQWQAQFYPESSIHPKDQNSENPNHSIVESSAANEQEATEKDNKNYI